MNNTPASTVTAIIDALADNGCYVGPTILSEATTRALSERLQSLADAGTLRDARVGRANDATRHASIRGDATLWLDDAPTNDVEAEAIRTVNTLRTSINEALFIGATETELHYARYPAGAFYKTHVDRFGDDDARLVSLVFYLNHDWQEANGGELVIYDKVQTTLHRVTPRAGTMIAFLSERFPHEVLPATMPRLSLTGWLRRRSA
jgi:SM-20-related protein